MFDTDWSMTVGALMVIRLWVIPCIVCFRGSIMRFRNVNIDIVVCFSHPLHTPQCISKETWA